MQRYWLLFLVVAGGICLTSLGFVAGSVAPLLLPETETSTDFYSYLLVVAAAFDALTAYFSALSDRIGRANLIVYGALFAGLIATFGVPTAHTKWEFAVWYCVMGFADGIALVGDATSLLLFLRELSPHLRGEVAYTADDELAIEARSSAADDTRVIAATEGAGKWKQVITPRMISANLAIMFYLVIFATAAGYLSLYNVEIQGMTISQANALGKWFWLANCVSLIGFGVISDRLSVRKPAMFVGAGVATMTIPALVGTAFALFGAFNRMSSVVGGLSIPHIIGSPIATESGWRVWFICCAVMMALFIPLCAYGLGGYYSPKKARAALKADSEANRVRSTANTPVKAKATAAA